VDEVLAARRGRLKSRIGARAEALAEALAQGAAGIHDPWLELADSILEGSEPREALSAALIEAFGADIDPARYREIQPHSVDAAATARLFVGMGKRDKATPRALASLVKRLSGLPDRLVGGIEVYENFSFVTVPFEAAERVLAEARRMGGLPAVRYATPRGAGPKGEQDGASGEGRARAPYPRKSGPAHKPGPAAKRKPRS